MILHHMFLKVGPLTPLSLYKQVVIIQSKNPLRVCNVIHAMQYICIAIFKELWLPTQMGIKKKEKWKRKSKITLENLEFRNGDGLGGGFTGFTVVWWSPFDAIWSDLTPIPIRNPIKFKHQSNIHTHQIVIK